MSTIKKNLLVIFILVQLINYKIAWSQINDSLQNQMTQVNGQLAEIKKMIIENRKDTANEVGKIVVKNLNNIPLYEFIPKKATPKTKKRADCTCDSVSRKKYKCIFNKCICHGYFKALGKTIDIDKIIILIKDGFIVDIQVIAGNRNFTNGRAPITISTERFNKIDGLVSGAGSSSEYIILNEILQYISIKPYIPDNDFFELTPSKNTHTLKKGAALNSVIDLRLYTDGLATFGGKSNGLIQTDASIKQVFHRANFRNRGTFLVNYFKFNLTASKFDSKVAFTDSSTFTRTSLFQKSWLNTDVSFNIINGWLGRKTLNSWYADLGGGVSLSDVAFAKDTSTITSTYVFLQGGLDIQIADNIGTSISSRFIWSYSPQTDFNNQDGERLFIKPSISIFWNPLGNEASRIFARATYNVDTKDKKNNFMQLQFGYALKLSAMVK